MEWLNTHVRASDGSLQETPEVFEAVTVDVPVNIRLGMDYSLVRVFGVQTIVGLQRIGVKLRSWRDVLANLTVKEMLPARANYRSANFASLTIEQSEHNGLAYPARPSDLAGAFPLVHIARLPPMKVSSASTVPVILLKVPWCWA